MDNTDFWGGIVAAQDNSKFKILTDDYKRLLGYPILLDDNVASGDIFFGDFRKWLATSRKTSPLTARPNPGSSTTALIIAERLFLTATSPLVRLS